MKMKQFKILILLCVFSFGINVLAQDEYPEISSAVDKEVVTVGESLSYTLIIKGESRNNFTFVPPLEGLVFWEEPADKKKDQTENVKLPWYNVDSVTSADIAEEKSLTVKIAMIYYRPGKYDLPLIKITDKNGTLTGYKIPQIEVKKVNEKNQLSDIEPPLDLSGSKWRLWLLIGIIVVVIGLIVAGIVFLVKRKKAKEAEPVAIDYFKVFMDDLTLLQKKFPIDEQGLVLVEEVSLIFRKFLSSKLELELMELTSDETIAFLKSKNVFGDDTLRELLKIFNLWDMAKFAEFSPSKEFIELNINETVALARRIARR